MCAFFFTKLINVIYCPFNSKMKREWMSDYNGIVAYIHFNTSVRRQKIYKYFLGHNVDFKILGIK